MGGRARRAGEAGAGAYKVPSYGLFGEDDAVGYTFFHVEPLDVRNAPNDWHIKTHLHPNMDQLSVVLSGDCEFEINGVWHEAKGSSIVYMPANVIHAFRYQPRTEGFIISCSRDFLNGMTGESPMLAEARQHLLKCRGSPIEGDLVRIRQVCSMLSDTTQYTVTGSRLEARYLFYHLWLLLKRSCGVPGETGPSNAGSEFRLFDRYRAALEETIRYTGDANHDVGRTRKTADFYAVRLDVSLFQLNKCCRQITGQTANELIKEALLAEATRLLLYTAIPVREMSDLLGYSNSSHFIRFFKIERGLAPDAFRVANTIFTRLPA